MIDSIPFARHLARVGCRSLVLGGGTGWMPIASVPKVLLLRMNGTM